MKFKNVGNARRYFAEFGLGMFVGLLMLSAVAGCIGFADSMADACSVMVMSLFSVTLLMCAEEVTR